MRLDIFSRSVCEPRHGELHARHVYRIDPLGIFDRLIGSRRCLLLPHRPPSFRHNCCPLSRPDLSDDKPDAQERPHAARPRHYPQRGERPRGDERSNGHARPEAPPARRMRADGERHWGVAVGPDRWALRFLTSAGRESPFLAGGDGAAGSIKIARLQRRYTSSPPSGEVCF